MGPTITEHVPGQANAEVPAPATAEPPPEVTFPLDSFREAARHLRRPFTPQAVKFKVQSAWPKENPNTGLIVAYIDARLVVERLNLLVPDLWFDEYQQSDSRMVCRLTVDGITRQDVGEGVGKGLFSDALKRAAVKFGIGVSAYAVPKLILNVSDGTVEQKTASGKKTLVLTPKGERSVRALYEKWLDESGSASFGESLSHGDVEGSVGDPDDSPEASVAPDEPEPQADEAGVAAEVVSELETMAKSLTEAGTWTTKALRSQLVAAGATDTSSVGAALLTLTASEAEALRHTMADLIAAGEER